MRYCRKCLEPDTRPNSVFDSEGVCVPCSFRETEAEENYEQRLLELKSLIKKIMRKKKKHQKWDCIVGVSGGKDSTRQALWVREKLEMNPLLVSVVYPQKQMTYNGADNLSNLANLGFDVLTISPAPQLSQRLVREAFLKFCNWCKATEMALFAGVPRVAVEKGIPLVFWGENPGLQVGDAAVVGESIWDGTKLVNSNTLAGGDLSWFADVAGGRQRLNMYMFPTREELNAAGVYTIFLGPAWKDWGAITNSKVALSHGLRFRNADPSDTGDLLGTRMVDEDWTIVNFLLKFYKLGFARGTDHANGLIRAGVISREEGIQFAELYDEACASRYIESFCSYIGITEEEFWITVKKFAHKELFDCSGARPKKLFNPGVGVGHD
ncbi:MULTISPECIES: N-acetyl sugar amidotransferase [unclassified Thiocapsa]|uniref:N-acetyl sugar amidotransferase n=1 Tax=unclassified Thiocapsa TaxID=2641286 RepID=UPI0035B297C7